MQQENDLNRETVDSTVEESTMATRKGQPKFIYAWDPKVSKRVLHAVSRGWAVSLVSGNKFPYRSGR